MKEEGPPCACQMDFEGPKNAFKPVCNLILVIHGCHISRASMGL